MSTAQKSIVLIQCKSYHPLEDTLHTCETYINAPSAANATLYVSAPYSYIEHFSEKFGPAGIIIGSEKMLSCDDKAFTAAISDKILTQANAKFVLIGTTEERKICQVNGLSLKNKIKTALKAGLSPFLCIGETWEEFEDGNSKKILAEQLKEAIDGLSPEELNNVYFVYEAPWIDSGMWNNNDEILNTAYNNFKEVVHEATDPTTHDTLHLIAAVPKNSLSLSDIIATIQKTPYSFAGLSLGIV